jgi:hypothetical protein
MNKLIEYFDLGSKLRRRGPEATEEAQTIHWLPQYVALLAGIAIQPLFQRYMAGTAQAWDLRGLLMWLAASIVIAIMAFPGVYKASFDEKKPIFVQLCVIFTAGTGWQTLVTGALKAAGVHNA